MRNIRKKIKTKQVECLVYDRATKTEFSDTYIQTEFDAEPQHPDNCVILEQVQTVSETESVYSMTPEEYVKHAKIEKE